MELNEVRYGYGYLRVSTEEQVEGMSLTNQRMAIQKYADDHNIIIIEWFIDEGVSAKTATRPELQRLIAASQKDKGKATVVVVYNLSRISRNVESFARDIGYYLSAQGVEVCSVLEPIDSTPTGRLMKNIFLAMHQFDNDLKSTTTLDNMKLVAKQGWWQHGKILGYKVIKIPIGITAKDGKQKTRSMLYPTEDATLVAKVLNRFSKGDITQTEILAMAEEIGLRSVKGRPLAFQTLNNMLKNPAYAGYLCYSFTDNEFVKAKHEPLISLDTFNTNQALLKNKKKIIVPQKSETYVLKHVLQCANCGRNLTGSAPRTGSGGKSPRYHCHRCKGMGSMSVDKAHKLFEAFLGDIKPTKGTVKLFKEVIKRTATKKLGDTNHKLAELRQQQSKIDNDRQAALQKFLDGEITAKDKDFYLANIEQQRLEVETRVYALEDIQRLNEATIDYVCNFIDVPVKMWRDSDYATKLEFQSMILPEGTIFDIKAQGFGTTGLSPLYRLNLNKKDHSVTEKSHLVIPRRIELRLPG
jgi:site-specific DNA recombinase